MTKGISLKRVLLLFLLLTFLFIFKGQCNKPEKEEMNFVTFPKVFFSSNAEQVKGFLTNEVLITTTKFDDQEITPADSVSQDSVHWHPWNNSLYSFINSNLTWEEAANACRSMKEHAHLVFIETDEEDTEVARLAKEIDGSRREWWIGLTDKESEGTWKWYNVTASNTHWSQGEPNGGDNEDCACLYQWTNYGNALWADVPCTWELGFICEELELK